MAASNAMAQTMLDRMNEGWPFSSAIGIFDNGCGSGSAMSRIIDRFGTEIPTSARLLAGDFSEHMLDAFRKTKEAQSRSNGDAWDRLELQNIDAHDLSAIRDESISHVTGGMLYFLLPDPQKALQETYRILCHGGVIATSNGKQSQHIDALNKAVEKVKPGTNLGLLSGVWTSEEGVKGELTAAGFVEAKTYLIESEVSYQNHQQFGEMLLQMPVMKQAIDGMSEDEKQRLPGVVVEDLRKINPTQPGTLSGTAIIAISRKTSLHNERS